MALFGTVKGSLREEPGSKMDMSSAIGTYFALLGGTQRQWQYPVCFESLLDNLTNNSKEGFSCLVLGVLLGGFWPPETSLFALVRNFHLN